VAAAKERVEYEDGAMRYAWEPATVADAATRKESTDG
jgi:hypothetical protein